MSVFIFRKRRSANIVKMCLVKSLKSPKATSCSMMCVILQPASPHSPLGWLFNKTVVFAATFSADVQFMVWIRPFKHICISIFLFVFYLSVHSHVCLSVSLTETNPAVNVLTAFLSPALWQPSTDGYIAVILPKFEESKSITENLLSREEFEKVVSKRAAEPSQPSWWRCASFLELSCRELLLLLLIWEVLWKKTLNCASGSHRHCFHGLKSRGVDVFHFENEDPSQRRETLIRLSLNIHDSASSFYVVNKDRTLS